MWRAGAQVPARMRLRPVQPSRTVQRVMRRLAILLAGAALLALAVPAPAAAAASAGDTVAVRVPIVKVRAPGYTGRPADAPVVVWLVRHAEKSVIQLGEDPPLSPAGEQRARELVHVLADAGITRVFVTHFRRARDTAQPLARLLGDSLEVVDDTPALVRRLQALPAGTRALVVGHSDTVPELVAALTGVSPPAFATGEWDRLYEVSWSAGQKPALTLLRYGAPRPAAASTP